jgi:hypothetical protein
MSPQLTPKALELIARTEAKNAVKAPIVIPHTSTWKGPRKPEPVGKMAPEDIKRRKYINWGGVDKVRAAGEDRPRQPLIEDYR